MNIEDYHTGNRIINSSNLSIDILKYMKEVFLSYPAEFSDISDFDPLDHMYLMTSWVDTNDPEEALRQFLQTNKQLNWLIGRDRDFYRYIPCQHAGVAFIDCCGSDHGRYVPHMTGLHAQGVAVVHPDYEQRYVWAATRLELDRLAAMDFDQWKMTIGGTRKKMHLKKIDPTDEDVLRSIRYCAKALMNERKAYFGREYLFEFFGPNQKPKNKKIKFRKSRKVIHYVNPKTLTKANSAKHKIKILESDHRVGA